MNWHQQRAVWLHKLAAEIKAAEDARVRYQEGKLAAIESYQDAAPGMATTLGRVAWHNSDIARALESEERWALDRANTYAAAITAITQAYQRQNGLVP